LNPTVTAAIVGARSAAQADGVMKAGELQLTPQDVSQIEASLSKVAA
jgi:aryl-alcohol dehydrogenase-like predicted oxidoreductase